MSENSENLQDNIEESSTPQIESHSESDKNKDASIDLDKILTSYEGMSLEELVKVFKVLLAENPIHRINKQVLAIKNAFNDKFSKLLAEKKEAFIEAGGESIDFKFTSDLKQEFNALSDKYRVEKSKFQKKYETELSTNLDLRLALIEELKSLIENAESSTMYNNLQEIQKRWKQIGPVAKEKYSDTWKTYHHHVERFYDLLHLNNDLRDLDFKHNLEKKQGLIDKVKNLSNHDDVNFAFKKLQDIHKEWKEDIGPVAKEMREDVWEAFSQATKVIHDKRHEYFKNLKVAYAENLKKKNEIIDALESMDFSSLKKHGDWQNTIKKIEQIRKDFVEAGHVSKADADKVWLRFKTALKDFNQQKNLYYKSIKSEQQSNLKAKLRLIELANNNKDSEDWEATSLLMKKIQSDWKKIGHVPRKYSDKIWNEFKASCNYYFDRLSAAKTLISNVEQEITEKKKTFYNALKEDFDNGKDITIDVFESLLNDWKSFGALSNKFKHVDDKFYNILDKIGEKLNIEKSEIQKRIFKSQIEDYFNQKDYKRLDQEKIKLRKLLDEQKRELQQLENNLSFFGNSNPNSPIIKSAKENIEKQKTLVEATKVRVKLLNNLDY